MNAKRSLSFMLDDNNYLPLVTASAIEIDELTFNNYIDSDHIRSLYAHEIEQYQKKQKNYIEEKKINPKGKIVIIESKDNKVVKIKVLYKKHRLVLETILKHFYLSKEARNKFIHYKNNDLVTGQVYHLVKEGIFPSLESNIKILKSWLNKDKKVDGYEKLRLIIAAYDNTSKIEGSSLPTINDFYEEYLNKKRKKNNLNNKQVIEEEIINYLYHEEEDGDISATLVTEEEMDLFAEQLKIGDMYKKI